MKRHSTVLAVISLSVLCLHAGCQPAFTRQQYETVYVGQTADDVQRALGQPTESTGTAWVYVHEKPYYRAEIQFTDGRVVRKSWSVRPATAPAPRHP